MVESHKISIDQVRSDFRDARIKLLDAKKARDQAFEKEKV